MLNYGLSKFCSRFTAQIVISPIYTVGWDYSFWLGTRTQGYIEFNTRYRDLQILVF
jgi:hypothetical protein